MKDHPHRLLNRVLLCCIAFFFGVCPFLGSQEKAITLGSNLSGSTREYVARDVISLLPGFEFAAANGQHFTASIDPTLIFPPASNYLNTNGVVTTDPTQGGVVGSISGQFAVSPTGGATYSIPIECPAGVNGMQPSISLVYNSQGGRGLAGWGWGLSGLSSISLGAKNIFSEQAVSGVDLSEKRNYYLDGNRLVLSSGVYGEVGAVYLTENNTFTKVQQVASPVNDVPVFTVTTKDGTVRSYSCLVKPPLSPHALQWLLSKVSDTNGNSIDYHYLVNSTGTQTVLDKIEYTKNGNVDPALRIEFLYDEKLLKRKQHIAGYYQEDFYLLKKIRLMSSSTELRSYSLTYDYRDETYFLRNVALNGEENCSLRSTRIEWGEENKVLSTDSVGLPRPSAYPFSTTESSNFYAADFSGDGISDLIEIARLKNSSYNLIVFYKANNHTATPSFSIHGHLVLNGYVDIDEVVRLKQGSTLIANFSTNNRCFLLPQYVNGSTGNYIYFNLLQRIDQEFTQPVDQGRAITIRQRLTLSNEIPVFVTADFNNDGKDELVYMEKAGNRTLQASAFPGKILYNKGSFFNDDFSGLPLTNLVEENLLTGSQMETFYKPENMFVDDFNNDGLKDILVLCSSVYYFLKNEGGVKGSDGVTRVSFSKYIPDDLEVFSNLTHNNKMCMIKTGDFNGDGLLDYIKYNGFNSFIISYNQGNFRFTSQQMEGIELFEDICGGVTGSDKNDIRDDFIITDFNHDGKSDLILVDTEYREACVSEVLGICLKKEAKYVHTTIQWFVSNGDSFSEYKSHTLTDEDFYFKGYAGVSDFDGDGREDFFNYRSNLDCLSTGDDSKLYFFRAFNTDFAGNLVTSVEDGWGRRTKVDYQPLTYVNTSDGSVFYTKGDSVDYPNFNLQFPLYCVRSISDTLSTTTYSYKGLQANAIGRGVLGFQETVRYNPVLNYKVSTQTQWDYTKCLPQRTVETRSIGVSPFTVVSSVENEFVNSKSGEQYLSMPWRTVEHDYLTTLSKTTEYINTDGYGNPTTVKSTMGNLVQTQYITYGQFGSWCPNKPIRVTSVHQLDGQTQTRRVDYGYDSFGNLLRETLDSMDVNQVTTLYRDMDVFGHPRTVDVKANGQTRSSSVTYTPSGRFIQSRTNALGETVLYAWDETRGLLISETSRLGTTHYTYDGLGRLTKTVYADGIQKSSVLRWASPGNLYGACYYSHSEASGMAPVRVWYDALGREVVHETVGFNDETIRTFTQYYADGKVKRVSEPTFETNTPSTWAKTYTYDAFDRPSTLVTPLGTTTYAYSNRTTTISAPLGSSQTRLYTNGLTEYSMQNGKKVTFAYYPSGLVKSSTPDGGQSLTMEYDLQGNRSKLIDPNAGTIHSVYNGYGECTSSSRLMHNEVFVTTTNQYAPGTGLLQNIVCNGETTSYAYDPLHRLTSIEIAGKHRQTFNYDDRDRIIRTDETVGAKTFTFGTEYDALGRVKRTHYPSGYYTTNRYDVNGLLTEVTDASYRSLWKALAYNAKGQLQRELRGERETSYDYDSRGFMTDIFSLGVLKHTYGFSSTGNLSFRQDGSQKEVFSYDAQQRLTNWNVYNYNQLVQPNAQSYDPLTGNIVTRSALDNVSMIYSVNGPHSLDTIRGVPPVIPADNLSVTYTDFGKIASLIEGNKAYTLTYGVDGQRRKSVYQVDDLTRQTCYYLGDYEEEIDATGNVRKIHYLSGGAVLIRNKGLDSLLFGYTDYLGSLTALTKEDGTVVERYAYDPWGRRRNPEDWTQTDNRAQRLLNRGYTQHEHLDAFQIINMNGRVYDPLTAQFFSPDPFVQAPGNWLNYNRYGYCLNNPLIYTDPSGEFWHIVIAAAVGGVVNTVSNWSEISKSANPWVSGIAYFANGAIAYGVSAAVPALTYQAMGVMGAGNIALDAAHGSLPSLNNSVDVGFYAVGTVLDMVGVTSAPGIASAAKSAFSKWGTEVAIEGTSKIVSRSLDGFAVEGAEWTIIAAKEASGSTASRLAMSLSDDAAKGGTKLLNQFNSAESLIQGAGNLTKVKAGMQGFVKGDGASIFKAISQGGTRQANGTILMQDGTTLFNHFSTKTGVYTIDINKAGQIYKIRVTP